MSVVTRPRSDVTTIILPQQQQLQVVTRPRSDVTTIIMAKSNNTPTVVVTRPRSDVTTIEHE